MKAGPERGGGGGRVETRSRKRRLYGDSPPSSGPREGGGAAFTPRHGRAAFRRGVLLMMVPAPDLVIPRSAGESRSIRHPVQISLWWEVGRV